SPHTAVAGRSLPPAFGMAELGCEPGHGGVGQHAASAALDRDYAAVTGSAGRFDGAPVDTPARGLDLEPREFGGRRAAHDAHPAAWARVISPATTAAVVGSKPASQSRMRWS